MSNQRCQCGRYEAPPAGSVYVEEPSVNSLWMWHTDAHCGPRPSTVLNPPADPPLPTFEEWAEEHERLLQSYVDWWTRYNDPDPATGESRLEALRRHARRRIRL